MLAEVPTTAERAQETGTRGSGGDRTLEIDQRAEQLVFDRARRPARRGLPVLRGLRGARRDRLRRPRGAGDHRPDRRLAERQARHPHYALSIAVADGETMADVAFGFVHDFGPGEEWWAWRGEGAWLDGVPLDPTLAERRGRDGRLEVLGIESADPRWIAASIEALAGSAYRLRALGTIAVSLCQVAAARFDGMVSLRRCRGGRRRRRPADRPRGRRPRQLPGCDRPAGRAARPPHSGRRPVDRRAARKITLADARRGSRRDRLGSRQSGSPRSWPATGDGRAARPPTWLALAAEAEAARRRLHGPHARAAAAAARGHRPRRSGWPANLDSMRALLDPVLERAGDRPRARSAGRCEIGIGRSCSAAEVGVVARLPGAARARPVRAGAARRGGRGPARRACSSCCPNLGQARGRRSGAEEDEFMTWVALHEVTHAVQFAGVPWLHAHLGRPRPRAARRAPRSRLDATAQAAHAQHRRGQAGARRPARRRPDLDRHQPRRSARRSTACRR